MCTLETAIDKYLEDAATRCEPSTIAHYKKRLRPFQKTLGSRELARVKAKHVLPLIESLGKWPDGSPKAPDTVRSNVSVWEQFQKWLKASKLIRKRITKTIPKPGGRKRELLPTIEETRKILEHASEEFRPIYRALRLTGARPGELCNATIADIDPTANEIVLNRHKTAKKTGKPRRIAIGHPSLVEIINTSIGDRTEGRIFLRSNGKPWSVPLLGLNFRAARTKAAARKDLVLYLTRHEHATALYQATDDLKAVADALGHAQLNTTMRYTRVTSEKLKQKQKLFNENID